MVYEVTSSGGGSFWGSSSDNSESIRSIMSKYNVSQAVARDMFERMKRSQVYQRGELYNNNRMKRK